MLFQRRRLEGVAEKPEEFFSVIYLFLLSHVHYNFLSEYHRVVVIFNLLPVNYALGNLMIFGANKNGKFPVSAGMRPQVIIYQMRVIVALFVVVYVCKEFVHILGVVDGNFIFVIYSKNFGHTVTSYKALCFVCVSLQLQNLKQCVQFFFTQESW